MGKRQASHTWLLITSSLLKKKILNFICLQILLYNTLKLNIGRDTDKNTTQIKIPAA